jgi:hypothetical protein
MMAHWRYMIDRLAAPVIAVSTLMSTPFLNAWLTWSALHSRCRGYFNALLKACRRRRRRHHQWLGDTRAPYDTMVVQTTARLARPFPAMRCSSARSIREAFFGGGRPANMVSCAMAECLTRCREESVPAVLGSISTTSPSAPYADTARRREAVQLADRVSKLRRRTLDASA